MADHRPPVAPNQSVYYASHESTEYPDVDAHPSGSGRGILHGGRFVRCRHVAFPGSWTERCAGRLHRQALQSLHHPWCGSRSPCGQVPHGFFRPGPCVPGPSSLVAGRHHTPPGCCDCRRGDKLLPQMPKAGDEPKLAEQTEHLRPDPLDFPGARPVIRDSPGRPSWFPVLFGARLSDRPDIRCALRGGVGRKAGALPA